MFGTLLIADRGEIVLRVARTCERLGIKTVALVDAGEVNAAYAAACDSTVTLTAGAGETLAATAVIAAAKEQGAEAIHPGTGPLACDAAFARAVAEAGMTFIGPAPEVLDRLAKDLVHTELAVQAGVRALPACAVTIERTDEALELAREIGYPLAVVSQTSRASGGITPALRGGALSLVIESEDELAEALARVNAAGGGSGCRLERRLEHSRRLSVQVVADRAHGVALGDVEHSLAVGDRIWLEEAPAPAFCGTAGERRRVAMRSSAVRVVAEAGIVGTAVVDFELDDENRVYLAAVRAQLSSEHPLIEMCARLDLVELQLRLAAGESLPAGALRVEPTGNAILARIYIESAGSDAGVELTALRWPMLAPGRLRVDSDLALGSPPAPRGDALIAKVTGFGPTRHQAVLTLDRALAEAQLEPLTTNQHSLREVLSDESFRAGLFDCDFVSRVLAQPKMHTPG